MELQLIISYFHDLLGPSVLMATPSITDPDLLKITLQILDFDLATENFEIVYDEYSLINKIFEFQTIWSRGSSLRIMISLICKKGEKVKNYLQILNKFQTQIITDPTLFKAFYISTDYIKDIEVKQNNTRLNQLMLEFYTEFQEEKNVTSFGKILCLGLNSVGKSTLIKRITTGLFDNTIIPTTETLITHTVLANIKFDIYDGFKSIQNPDAIIFVLDLANLEQFQEEEQKLFAQIMEEYCLNNPFIPILILGNKIDQIPLEKRIFQQKRIKNILQIGRYSINFHIGLISAVTNEGIGFNVQWLTTQSVLANNIKWANMSVKQFDRLQKLHTQLLTQSPAQPLTIISDFWFYTQDGIELFSYTPHLNFDPVLLESFLNSLQAFSNEFSSNGTIYFVINDSRFAPYQVPERNLVIFGRSNLKNSNEEASKVLQQIYNLFVKEYEKYLTKFDGNVIYYQDFTRIIKNKEIQFK